MGFALDAQLARDCFELGRIGFCRLLLMNNADIPWFILVPETTRTELCDLAQADQHQVWEAVNAVCAFLRDNQPVDKLNVAAIGNMVRQLHVHVVGRTEDDCCWPGVVWGSAVERTYNESEVEQIRQAVAAGVKGFTA